jgi:hypothetical protein
LAEFSRLQNEKQRAIQKLLDDAKKGALKRTASYNVDANAERAAIAAREAAEALQEKPRMFVMHERPNTSHVDLRRNRETNAEQVARQINAYRTVQRLQRQQERAVDHEVAAADRARSEAEAAAALENFRRGQKEYIAELAAQEAERAALAEREAAEEAAAAAATKPFKQNVPDEEYECARRANNREAVRANVEMERRRQEHEVFNARARTHAHTRARAPQPQPHPIKTDH